jgi:NadR type nicotinamide-nucleotide adenylyltransferase
MVAVAMNGERDFGGHPPASWNHLAPSFRAAFALRICVIGAESTGSTTLARALAGHYGTPCVADYASEYSITKRRRGEPVWTTAEFLHIAREQARREDLAARQCTRVLICDSDAWATETWHERHLRRRSFLLQEVAEARRRPELYLLTSPGVPFDPDGTRIGEHTRDWMHRRYVERLASSPHPWLLVSGSAAARLHQAIDAIDELLGALAAPRAPRVPVPAPSCHGHRAPVDERFPWPQLAG